MTAVSGSSLRRGVTLEVAPETARSGRATTATVAGSNEVIGAPLAQPLELGDRLLVVVGC